MSPRRWSSRWSALVFSVAVLAPVAAAAQGVEAPRMPLRTVMSELATMRAAYTHAVSHQDAAALAAMYAPNAMAINGDGTTMNGMKEITEGFKTLAPTWTSIQIKSDTVQVAGGAAWDMGTAHIMKADGKEENSRYLVVLRRGMHGWKIVSSANVPVTGM